MTHSTSTVDVPPSSRGGYDRWFELTERGSTVGREVRGGLVTFFTMAYIIVLNPIIIGGAADKFGNLINGMPKYSNWDPNLAADQLQVIQGNVDVSMAMVAVATAVVAGVMTILMGSVARFPLALAAGLGLNSLVAYTIAPQVGWVSAMGLIFWEGIIITVLVLTGFRRAVLRAVPRAIRSAISVGIGLFIAFVGLADSHMITQAEGTPVQLGIGGVLKSWPVAIFVITLFILIALYVRKVKGAILIAILVGTVLAVLLQLGLGLPASSAADPTGWALNAPEFRGYTAPDFGLLGVAFTHPTDFFFGAFMQANGFGAALGVLLLIFSLLLADFFDTMGTIVAVGAEGGLLQKSDDPNENGNPKHTQQILLIDSLAAMAGGLGSTSSNTSYIESASGVGEGARTGIASIVTGVAFLLCLVLSPFVNMVPSEAAAPALFFVGCLMMAQVVEIDWGDVEQAIPAFVALALMPFTYSITNGIGAGFLAYVFIKTIRGKAKDVHPLLWVVAVAFLIYFGQGLISLAIG